MKASAVVERHDSTVINHFSGPSLVPFLYSVLAVLQIRFVRLRVRHDSLVRSVCVQRACVMERERKKETEGGGQREGESLVVRNVQVDPCPTSVQCHCISDLHSQSPTLKADTLKSAIRHNEANLCLHANAHICHVVRLSIPVSAQIGSQIFCPALDQI